MSERVMWQCNECRGIQLIPIIGQNYQPRNWAPLDDIPKALIDAVIAVEDRRFYSHHGIDLYRTCGALVAAIRSEEHTSELQSHSDLVCRLLLEKKKKK